MHLRGLVMFIIDIITSICLITTIFILTIHIAAFKQTGLKRFIGLTIAGIIFICVQILYLLSKIELVRFDILNHPLILILILTAPGIILLPLFLKKD